MTTDAGRALRATSDTLLRDIESLSALEEEKRVLDPTDPRRVELAARVEELAGRLLEASARQHRLVTRIQDDPTLADRNDSIEETPRSIASILAAWREAERRLATTEPGSPDADLAEAEVDRCREEYRRAHAERDRRP